jgi:two-component system nitrogen regulation sensor histidine kinase NtrY
MKSGNSHQRILWISGLLVALILAYLVSVIFLNPSSVGNQNFLRNFNLWAFVWALIFILVLALMISLARYLIRVLFEYQSGYPGSRIKTKLILTFVLFSLFPALIMAFLAFGLINQNLTTWVSAPSEQLLKSSMNISQMYYRELEQNSIARARQLAERWQRRATSSEALLVEARAAGYRGLLLCDSSGSVVLRAGTFPEPPPLGENRRLLEGGTLYRLEPAVNLSPGIVDRIWIGVPIENDAGGVSGSLLLFKELPGSVAFHLQSVAEANQVYKGLKGTLASLRLTYILVLAMTTLAVVFGFVWLGNYIARRLTVPLEALAEGSRELASGNLDYRIGIRAPDELGIVVGSFNRMAEELKDNRQELEATNEELRKTNIHLDDRRRYIETILQNIATGVITIDEQETVRTANDSALKMLQRTASEILSRPLWEISEGQLNANFQEMKKRALLYGTYRKQLTLERASGGRLFVAATMTTNRLADELEYLVVLDDLTELIRAERFAAWQEVARRLAHEIKNPLTPIQLSTERIQRRFQKLAPTLTPTPQVVEFQQVLDEASRIIQTESRILKNLLSEFSRFARLPMCKPERIDLHALIEETLKRYNGSLAAITLQKQYDSKISSVNADPEQLQRVLTNLLDNSLDALVDEENRRIEIRTVLNDARRSVTIELSDNGPGIAAEDYEHLFLPYFSTKKKGTGLGLAIVRQIVTDHNGFIRAEPNLPKGTRFIVELPLEWKADHESPTADR